MNHILVGVFDNSSQARDALTTLAGAGIEPASMRLSGGDPDDAATAGVFAPRREHVVLTVTLVDDPRGDEVHDLMRRRGAIHVDERVERWPSQDHPGQAAPRPDAPADAAAPPDAARDGARYRGPNFTGLELCGGL